MADYPVMSIDEFCAAMKIAKSTYYEWAKHNEAPPIIRVRGRVYITRAAFETWLAGRATTEAAQ